MRCGSRSDLLGVYSKHRRGLRRATIVHFREHIKKGLRGKLSPLEIDLFLVDRWLIWVDRSIGPLTQPGDLALAFAEARGATCGAATSGCVDTPYRPGPPPKFEA